MSGQDVNFSPREIETLAAAWQCLDTDPKIDFVKLAQLTGYTEGSARFSWGVIKKKLKAKVASSGGGPVSAPKTPKTPRSTNATPKKRGAANINDTPSKKSKQNGRPLPVNVDNPVDDDEEFEFRDLKVKKEELEALDFGLQNYYDGR